MEGVKNAVQNGIENLSGSSVSSNAHPEDGYRYRARTRDELIQSQQLAANSGVVKAGQQTRDPAVEKLGAGRWTEDGRLILPEANVPATPPPKQEGWIL